jgi:hypothetical protein
MRKVMKRTPPSPAEIAPTPTSPSGLPALWQVVLSVALVVHLLALLTAPLQVAAQGSPAIRPLALLQPYVNLLHLNHAYFFFAPNPGPSHLVRYELEFAEGPSVVGQFPDRREQWPRLLYHRYFMLSESLYNAFVPPAPPREPPVPREDASAQDRREYRRAKAEWDEGKEVWQRRRDVYEALHKSISDHLQAETGAKSVTLIRREHSPLLPLDLIEDRLQLTDEQTYRNLPEVPSTEELPWNPLPSR